MITKINVEVETYFDVRNFDVSGSDESARGERILKFLAAGAKSSVCG